MAHFSELQVRRRLMGDYITRSAKGADGKVSLTIALKRPVTARTSTGGVGVTSTLTLPAQAFGIMPFKRRQTDEEVFTAPSHGRDRVTKAEFLLIAEVDADVQQGDWFQWDYPEHLQPGKYMVEYVAQRSHDRKLVGIYQNGHGA